MQKNQVQSSLGFSPFGMIMPKREFSVGYRFGFNGQEKDDEVSGAGNTMTAEFWEYDARLGRRFNLDPKPNPSLSLYACFANNPVFYIDPNGDTINVSGKNKREVKSFISMLSKRTGNKYGVNENGNVYNKTGKINTKTNSRKSGELSEQTENLITDENTIELVIVKNSTGVLFDHFDNGQVDIGDFKKSAKIMQAGLLGHIFSERSSTSVPYSLRTSITDYSGPHRAGLLRESSIVAGMLKQPFISVVTSETLIVYKNFSGGVDAHSVRQESTYGAKKYSFLQGGHYDLGGTRFNPDGSMESRYKLRK